MRGILLVDKPSGMTSHDVVDRVRRAARTRRVGHTGTLDPAATGLLIICIGSATRLSEHFTGLDKTYEGTMRLGIETSSYDLDGEILVERPVPDVDAAAIQKECDLFTGTISQIPPMVSAVKVDGERLYKLARKGEVVDRPARKVTVHRFDVVACELPDVSVVVTCSSGTYVRSLCHDVGQRLGCGAALASLRRTAVGRHCVEQALALEDLISPEVVAAHLLPMGEALDLPVAVLEERALTALSNGNPVSSRDLAGGCPVNHGWVQLKDGNGELLALGVVEPAGLEAFVHPRRVFLNEQS